MDKKPERLVCSGIQNLHCGQRECPHHKEHDQHETCEQTFCSLKRTSCYCYNQTTEPTKPIKQTTKPVKQVVTTNEPIKQSFAERLAQLLQKR